MNRITKFIREYWTHTTAILRGILVFLSDSPYPTMVVLVVVAVIGFFTMKINLEVHAEYAKLQARADYLENSAWTKIREIEADLIQTEDICDQLRAALNAETYARFENDTLWFRYKGFLYNMPFECEKLSDGRIRIWIYNCESHPDIVHESDPFYESRGSYDYGTSAKSVKSNKVP